MGRPRKPKELLEKTGSSIYHPEVANYGDSKLVAFPKGTQTIEPSVKFKFKKTRQAWDLTVMGLLNMSVLGPLDVPMLEQLFLAYDEMLRVQKCLEEFDKLHKEDYLDCEVIKARKTLSSSYKEAFQNWFQLCTKFGISPEARSHLLIPKQEEEKDPLDLVLGN